MSFAVLAPHKSSLAIVGIGIGPNTSRLIDELGPNGLSWSIPVYMHESALPPHPALCVCPCKLLAEIHGKVDCLSPSSPIRIAQNLKDLSS